ncbi:MAG: hypothetical protein ABFD64_10830 [Armatimonadota bacterium]
MGEKRIQWEEHILSLLLAAAATCYALWKLSVLPTDINLVLTARTIVKVNTSAFIARQLAVIWALQIVCIFQTRQWVAREVRKRFNYWYAGLTSVVICISCQCLTALCCEASAPSITDLFIFALLFAVIIEKKRLFVPREISKPDDFMLPGNFPALYAEQDWRFEWVLLLKCISLLPAAVFFAMHAMSWIMWIPGILPFFLLAKIIPPDSVEWQVDRYLIRYRSRRGDKLLAQRDWQMDQINFVEVLDFDPKADFDDEEPRNGISEVFEGVQGYFNPKCRRGIVIGTLTGEFYMLGFMRPRYAAAMIKKFAGIEEQLNAD